MDLNKSEPGKPDGPGWFEGRLEEGDPKPVPSKTAPTFPAPTQIPGTILLICPACAAEIFGITNVGDVSICIACRAMMVLDAVFTWVNIGTWFGWKLDNAWLRRPTEREEDQWFRDPRVNQAIAQVAAHHAAHGSPHPGIASPDGDDRPPY